MITKRTTTRTATALLSFALLAASGVASAQYYQGPPPQGPGYDRGGWDAPPPQFAAAQQRGFHDGVEGARRDFDNHRRPDVNNRDEYRNPHFIAPPDRQSYREGFRQGYRVAVEHIYRGR
ncbi:hypothetical protein [Granulicella paludicola]|uniref:hypothetical protein n=1 Tax=Granulicella paludicola TaxID=474951 RepID=UPI0021E06392|nr:hypothetical protein [Granulicella paludicola]